MSLLDRLQWRSSLGAAWGAVSDQSRPRFALRCEWMIRAGIAALVPVAIAVLAEGGYSAGARVAFGVAGVCAGTVALRRGAWRDRLVVVLLGLAAVGGLSALWTLGPVDRTLRWALVCAGYAGVVAAAAAVARRPRGVELLAGGGAAGAAGGRRRGGVEVRAGAGAAMAIAAGLAGLIAAALHEPPFAERLEGVWRPGGPFEYPPALALLEVSALPVLLAAVTS